MNIPLISTHLTPPWDSVEKSHDVVAYYLLGNNEFKDSFSVMSENYESSIEEAALDYLCKEHNTDDIEITYLKIL